MLKCYRRQFAVGQGGLHLGIITYYDLFEKKYKNFAYLYDCGSTAGKKVLSQNIDELIERLNITSDLSCICIFISHVHSDHINGLSILANELLRHNFSPIYVILPYMEEAERLIKIGSLIGQIGMENIIRFLIDPHNILPREINIRYLGDSDNFGSPEPIIFGDINPYPFCDRKNKNNNDFLNHNYPIVFPDKDNYIMWLLLPYYNKINKKILEEIKKTLKKIGISIHNFTRHHYSEDLRFLYEKYRVDLNFSSMCLYSGTNRIMERSRNGWIHTGDINFNASNEYGNTLLSFINHYNAFIDNVRVIQIPHHGSSNNSKLNDFKVFKNLNNYLITESLHTNGHSQPHVSDEYKNNLRFIHLREDSDYIWSYEQTNNIIWSNFA